MDKKSPGIAVDAGAFFVHWNPLDSDLMLTR
jgi:hypothetical protein